MNLKAVMNVKVWLSLPLLALAACSDSNNSTNDTVSSSSDSSEMMSSSSEQASSMPAYAMFSVRLMNASAAQILSPAVVFLQEEKMSWFEVGMPASNELEKLAEAGMPDDLVAKYMDVVSVTSGPTMAGATTTLEITDEAMNGHYISLLSMPVYTNDAFVAVQNIDVSGLAVGESMALYAPVYDAGTELNTESMNSIPGPEVGGEAYSDARDDINTFVTMHPGVVGEAELESSVLSEKFRFSADSFKIMIERTQ